MIAIYIPYAYNKYTHGECTWIVTTMSHCGESSMIYHNGAT